MKRFTAAPYIWQPGMVAVIDRKPRYSRQQRTDIVAAPLSIVQKVVGWANDAEASEGAERFAIGDVIMHAQHRAKRLADVKRTRRMSQEVTRMLCESWGY